MSGHSTPKHHQVRYRVATVILNFNSARCVQRLVPQLLRQNDCRNTVVVVDNASTQTDFNELKSWIVGTYPSAPCGQPDSVMAILGMDAKDDDHAPPLIFIHNPVNSGYSAGNNIGIKAGLALGAAYILIANPDMDIGDGDYVATLARALDFQANAAIAASRIVDVRGADQNPQREARFAEELLWPIAVLRSRRATNTYRLDASATRITEVPKVSGCCMMLSSAFLKRAGLLDENVFLYSEEAILARKAIAANMHVLYVPEVKAVHRHTAPQNGNVSPSMRRFVRSRLYYLERYSGYKAWQIGLLRISYTSLLLMHKLRGLINKAGGSPRQC
jgi:GT2 family glycosyltransferase